MKRFWEWYKSYGFTVWAVLLISMGVNSLLQGDWWLWPAGFFALASYEVWGQVRTCQLMAALAVKVEPVSLTKSSPTVEAPDAQWFADHNRDNPDCVLCKSNGWTE